MVEEIFQFKVTLKGIKPTIWRRIQVIDSYSFWDLHVAIQDAMGWEDYHLHCFEVFNPKLCCEENIGSSEGDNDELFDKASWKAKVKDYLDLNNNTMLYEYDFGDCWKHIVKLEKILIKQPNKKYPICVDGKRACPPEDVGGIHGYEEFLQIIKNKRNPRHKEILKWIGGAFDSEHFYSKEVVFASPKERLKDII